LSEAFATLSVVLVRNAFLHYKTKGDPHLLSPALLGRSAQGPIEEPLSFSATEKIKGSDGTSRG
jgi:hypothetical protein